MNTLRLITVLLFATFVHAQEGPLKHFQVIADSVSTAGIHAINLVTEKWAVTDHAGKFSLHVKEDEMIVLSSVNFEYKRKLIEADDLAKDLIVIKVIPKITQLEEVRVNAHPEINAVALGIIPAPVKQFTPAERRLMTAGDFKWWHLIGILGGQLPIDPIINAISGRTERLKKVLQVERKELLMEQLQRRFDEQYFTNRLGIPPEYVKGFLYYAADDPKVAQAVQSKNHTRITFALSEVATEYKSLISRVRQ